MKFVDSGKWIPSTILWRLDPVFIKHSHGCGVQRVLVALGDSPEESRGADPCASPPVNLWQQVLLAVVLVFSLHLYHCSSILRIDVALVGLFCVNWVPHSVLVGPVVVLKYLLVLSLEHKGLCISSHSNRCLNLNIYIV